MEPGQRGDCKGTVCRAQEAFGAGLDERGERDGEFADSQPAHAAGYVFGNAHAGHGLDGKVAEDERVFPPLLPGFFFGHGGFPEEVADEVVFADVVGEEVDSGGAVRVRGGEVVEVRAAEHVGFADYAGGDGDGVDGGVEFGVGGGEEEFFEPTAAAAKDRGECRMGLWSALDVVACCTG